MAWPAHPLSMNSAVNLPSAAGRSRHGAPDHAGLSDRELLEALFTLVAPAPEAKSAAACLLRRHGGMGGLLRAATAEPPEGLCEEGPWLPLLGLGAEVQARRLREQVQRGSALTSPAETVEFLQHGLRWRRREIFLCLFLDTRHRVICHEELFQGSIDGACVYPRVVAEHALRHNAAAVIIAHNHPSGVTEPSLADQAITRRLKDALSLLEIRLLDHFVIGDGEPVSMASRGML